MRIELLKLSKIGFIELKSNFNAKHSKRLQQLFNAISTISSPNKYQYFEQNKYIFNLNQSEKEIKVWIQLFFNDQLIVFIFYNNQDQFINIKYSELLMQIQAAINLSNKSRAILYRFKTSLKDKNLLLDTHICNVFQYRKNKFSRKQFHKLILKFDSNLILSDVDLVFQELDFMGNNSVLYDTLLQTIEQINEDDDPSQSLNRKSAIFVSKKQRNSTNALIQLKDILIQNQDYLQTVQLFITEKDGFLSKINVQQLLDNLHIRDQNKVKLIISQLFGENDKIQLIQFLQKLDLNNDGTRIRLSDYSINQSVILDTERSQFIKTQRKSRASQSFNLQYSKILEGISELEINNLNSGFYALQKIPRPLQPYFNYGSQLQQPFATLACNFIQNNLIFIDQQGPTYGKAAKWVHIAQIKPDYFLFEAAQSIVYRQKDRKGLGMLLQPKDITQGKYGNCYFLSALAAIVEYYPQLVYRLFVLQKNPSHIFGVWLFVDGIWKTISVDGCFPLNQKGNFCGAQPHHNEIWVMLLEKAWAKLFKTYESIHSGYNQEGLVALSGAPTIIFLTKQEGYLEKVQQQFKKGSIITCTTAKSVSQISQVEQQKLGVFAGHAYTILRIYSDVKTDEGSLILLKMKNPWGTKAWKGDWSFKSNKWTPRLRQQMNYTIDSNDGTFFICLQDFVKYFDHINISKVNLGNRNSSITNNANRYDFYCNRVTITQGGIYFFTIYQDNGRKFKNGSGVYQKSPSWIFLARIAQKTDKDQILGLDAIACNASGYQHSTVQAALNPGQYVILSKVSWNYWQQHPYVIASYGPNKVKLDQSITCSLELIIQFIISWSTKVIERNGGTTSLYKNTTIWKSFYFDHTEGLGFISIGNNENKIIQSTLTLEPCKGIEILAPFSNPICIRAQPNQVVTCAFLIDPQGYSYKMMESYKLFILQK